MREKRLLVFPLAYLHTCQSFEKYQGDFQRDFSNEGARALLYVTSCLKDQPLPVIVEVTHGKTVSGFRYHPCKTSSSVQETTNVEMAKLSRTYPKPYYHDLILSLVENGYMSAIPKSSTMRNGYKNSWTAYKISPQGVDAVQEESEIVLPVPESVREIERMEQETRSKKKRKAAPGLRTTMEIPKGQAHKKATNYQSPESLAGQGPIGLWAMFPR